MASLIVVAGPHEGDYYPLGKRPMVVGRDEACPVQITDELVSRKHLQVRLDEPRMRYMALDMKSANGVFVNGRKIDTETELADGDMIELGKSKIMFTAADFKDRQSAMNHFHKRGERGKSTLIR
jgi:pSer/pThr/pTyr-binding forkhead associated (FHA) protein